jgi:CrcB protein
VLNYILFILFGMLGAVSRYLLSVLFHASSFPIATLVINLCGCFLLAVVARFLIHIRRLPASLISAVGTGFIGSFTTFSAFALETVELIRRNLLLACIYAGTSLFGGLAAAALGYLTARLLLNRLKGSLDHDHQ